ncbi:MULTISPECIES: hypothetical protein [Staphylococcus]|uniref:Uncharacterized protein n=1 Tax=Staphylococcus agnetis TaxID=985762 RepID=A0AAW9YWR5_9STAP|nr:MULTISPECIES: hypothetical protein [Staphylococcus]NHM92956.1 hypothetical protein [Staphylococcus sp. 10602379]NJI03704.1 hypothetical protein [Staphylococcus agnetis]
MKAIDILEELSSKIKSGNYEGNIGYIVEIENNKTLQEVYKAKSILEPFVDDVKLRIVEPKNYKLTQFPYNKHPVVRISTEYFGKKMEK